MKRNIYLIEELNPYYLAQGPTGAIVIATDKKQAANMVALNKVGKIKKVGESNLKAQVLWEDNGDF